MTRRLYHWAHNVLVSSSQGAMSFHLGVLCFSSSTLNITVISSSLPCFSFQSIAASNKSPSVLSPSLSQGLTCSTSGFDTVATFF